MRNEGADNAAKLDKKQSLYFAWMNAFREVNASGKHFTAAQMGVLFSLATYADKDGNKCHPGYDNLRKGTGAVNDTIKVALTKAVTANVICLDKRAYGRRADVYSLVHPDKWRLGASDIRNGDASQDQSRNAVAPPDIRPAARSDIPNPTTSDIANRGGSDFLLVTKKGTAQSTSQGTTQVTTEQETEEAPNRVPDYNRATCGCGRDCFGWGFKTCRDTGMTESEWVTYKAKHY